MVMGHNYEQSTMIYMYRNIMMSPIVLYAKFEKFKEVSLERLTACQILL